MRCGIAEDDEPASAREKLRAALSEHLPDPDERQWVEPRLAHLLALQGAPQADEENLFSAWRILFERLAEQSPTVLVFEDMQWADAGLLDFLEYLLDWSRGLPLLVLVLGRPEFAEERPAWGAGRRGFTSLYLEPLSPQAMGELMSGLVPGLPDELRSSILARAEGIPALRGRDGTHAARPRSARAGRRGLSTDRLDRRTRGARDPARADRVPARQSHRRGAAPGPGCLRRRQDVH